MNAFHPNSIPERQILSPVSKRMETKTERLLRFPEVTQQTPPRALI